MKDAHLVYPEVCISVPREPVTCENVADTVVELLECLGVIPIHLNATPEDYKCILIDSLEYSANVLHRTLENTTPNQTWALVTDERKRQDSKWGEQNHDPINWLLILGEEVGEVAKAACEWKLQHRIEAEAELRKELVQVCAVTLAMLQCGERNKLWE